MNRFFVLIASLLVVLHAPVWGQTTHKGTATVKIKVAGNCGMCKERIEDAAYGKGVRHAVWDKTAGEITVTYRADRTSREEIMRRIAGAGHEAGTVPADDSAYQKLPNCCAYKTNPHRH